MKKNYITTIILIIVIVVGVLLLYQFFVYRNNNSINYIAISDTVMVNNVIFNVDIANTKKEIESGLSGRKELLENNGMLFVFEKSGVYPFWMKDMNFPIDIIWIDKNLKIIYIKEKAEPNSYPKIFNTKAKALYVLEVNAGEVKKNKIKIGNIIILNTHNTKQ